MSNSSRNNSIVKILFFCLLLSMGSPVYCHAQITLKVGAYDNKPIIFVGDDGEVQGLFVDVLEEIANRENWRLEYIPGQFSDVLVQLKEGKIDIFPAIAYSKQREEIIDYTNETIMANWAALYVPRDRKIISLLGLEGKKVGVTQGDIHFTALKELTDRFNISCRFIEADENKTVFEMLQANFVDVGVVNRLYGKRNKQKYSVIETPVIYNPIEIRFAATKGKHRDILTKIDSYMLSFLADEQSIYYQSINRWFVVDSKKVLPRWIFYLFIVVTGAIFFFFGASLLFKRQVRKRTDELMTTNLLLESQIVERIKAEEKLKVSEERSRTWLEHSPVYTSIVDLDFNLQYMSSAGIKSLHIKDIMPFYGKPFPFDFCSEAFKNVMIGNLKITRETGEITEQEAVVMEIDGRELWFHSTVVPVNDDKNQIEYIIVVSLDVTERKRAEKEKENLENRLLQAQKMEAIGTLAGGIAHDFNNILGAIIGYTEMAHDDIPNESSAARDLDKVLEASSRAVGLVKQILSFSRQDETEYILLQPASIVTKAITLLRPALPSTIEITQDIDTKTGPIFGDPTQIHQVLMNLCTNAFHAMEETGGRLHISIKEIDLHREDITSEPHVDTGTFIQLSVGDSGAGMTQQVKDKIFEPYFTTKGVGKGTGMGLSIVHGIIKSYGGFITISSESGKGTTFHIFLPVVYKEVLLDRDAIKQIPIGREKILFIDDEDVLADMGKDMLERLGYRVTVRKNSLEALETFQSQPDQFDVVITDQTMPGMTGVDLARRMLQIRPDIPIILCTGYSSIISEEKAKAIGIKEFALKPLGKSDIAILIRKVLLNNKMSTY